MEGYSSLNDIWAHFDGVEKKGFLAHEISAAINTLPEDNPEAELCRYEVLAFDFAENCNDKDWGIYYGPQWTFVKKDNREDVYVPDIKYVTKEIVDYWEHRCTIVKNPLLKMRYSGLVLELKKRVTKQEPDFKSIKITHIRALIDVVSGDFCKYETIALGYADRALQLAIQYNNIELQKEAVKVFYEAHMRLSKEDLSSGIWGKIFQSLIQHRPYFSDYEDNLVQEQLERFERLKNLALNNGGKTDRYAHVLADQIDLLADYYHLIEEKEKIEPLLDTMLAAIRKSIPLRGGMWGQGMIQQLQSRYRKYGFDKKANSLFVDLQDLGELTLRELKPTELSIPLDTEQIKSFLDEALNGSNNDVLLCFLIQYLPKIEDERNKLKEKTENSPLLDLTATVMIDSSGAPISRVGVGPDAERQKLYFSMYENMKFSIPFMHLHITKMKEQGKMTTESMMDLINDSMLITEDHREIVKRGFEAFIQEDYLVCCHLLVPQLEAAIRRLFAINGVNIMRPKKNPSEGNEYLSLDSLLGSSKATIYMGEDIANYFRNVLTDQYGWNIRNQVSHGLLSADSFTFGMADRVIHAFLMLGVLKPVDESQKDC